MQTISAESIPELRPKKSIIIQISLIYSLLTLTNILIFWVATGANQIRLISENAAHMAQTSSLDIVRRFDAKFQNVENWRISQALVSARAKQALQTANGPGILESYQIVDDRGATVVQYPEAPTLKRPAEFELNLFRAIQVRQMKYQPFYAAPDLFNFKLDVFIPLTDFPSGGNLILCHTMAIPSLKEEFFALLRLAIGMVILLLGAQTFFGLIIYRRLVSPVISVSQAAYNMASGSFAQIEKKPRSHNEVYTMIEAFNLMSRQLQAKQEEIEGALGALREKDKRSEYELEIANKIQTSILPKELELGHVKASLIYKPLYSVSGDYFDMVRLGDGSVAIFIGDASGHGVPAAFLTMFAKVFFTSLVEKIQDPAALLGEINRLLCLLLEGNGLYLTAFYIRIYPDNTAEFCNCMHPEPIVLRREGGLISFESLGFFLGIMPEAAIPFQTQKFTFQPGDKLVLFTDGVNEAQNASKEIFGLDRLKEVILELSGSDADRLAEGIYGAVTAHQKGEDFDDDVTLAVLAIQEVQASPQNAVNQFRRKNFTGAISGFSNLIRSEVQPVKKWRLYLAESLMKTNDFSAALKNYLHLYENSEVPEQIALRTGICRLKLHDYHAAARDFARAIQMKPDYALAHAHRALALYRLDEKAEAVAAIETAIRLDSENPKFRKFKSRFGRV